MIVGPDPLLAFFRVSRATVIPTARNTGCIEPTTQPSRLAAAQLIHEARWRTHSVRHPTPTLSVTGFNSRIGQCVSRRRRSFRWQAPESRNESNAEDHQAEQPRRSSPIHDMYSTDRRRRATPHVEATTDEAYAELDRLATRILSCMASHNWSPRRSSPTDDRGPRKRTLGLGPP